MFKSLKIENFGLFESVDVGFHKGLNVLTGESGAGKTMFLKSISQTAGAKPEADLIFRNKDEAYIEAYFESSLPASLLEITTGDEFSLARRIMKEGQSRSLVNGRAASAGHLKEAADEIMTRTDQHSSIRLKNTNYQLSILDSTIDQDSLISLADLYRDWQEKKSRLSELAKLILDREKEVDLIRADVEAWEAVLPEPGELDDLEKELSLISDKQKILDSLKSAHHLIYSESLDAFSRGLSVVSDLNINMDQLKSQMSAVEIEMQDIAVSIKKLAEELDLSEERSLFLEERISAIRDLNHRFRQLSIEEIDTRVSELKKDLNLLENSDKNIEKLKEEADSAQQKYIDLAKEVSRQRKSSAKKITGFVEKYLEEINLKDARVKFVFAKKDPGLDGIESVEILFAANKNMPLAPIGKGASGGELSRINLAIALALAEAGGQTTSVYVFDEIDAGISGDTAHKVGRLLRRLSEKNQVILITHLVQIAVHADKHFLIEKEKDRAVIKHLDESEREYELSRLIGLDDKNKESLDLIRKVALAK